MEYLKYLPLSLFTLAVGKGLIIGFSWVDAPILLILGGIAAFYEFKSNDKKVALLQTRLDLVDKHLTEFNVKLDKVQTHSSAMSLGQQYVAQMQRK